MAYTIGVKRRFLPGYRRVQVMGHDWRDGRFILNLTDRSQEHVPGAGLKVYPDFWTHLDELERIRAYRAAQTPSQWHPVSVEEGPFEEPAPTPEPEPPEQDESPEMQEVKRRARARVQSISRDLQ